MTSQRIRPKLLDLPFSLRWRKQLARCRSNGGWHLLGAASQAGKTKANLQYTQEHPAVRSSAGTTMLVAQGLAARLRRPLLRSLAESIGGPQLAQRPHRELRVPQLARAVGCELIIINNAHHMTWSQWEELLNFDDMCARYEWRPAIVFSGVFDNIATLPGLSPDAMLNSQVLNRVQSRTLVRGHDLPEVSTALSLLAAEYPRLAGLHLAHHATQVFELLTSPLVDPKHTGFVGTGDLTELVWRIDAARAKKPEPVGTLIAAAYAAYTKSMNRRAA